MRVTTTPPAGAGSPKLTLPPVCRLWPIEMSSVTAMPGIMTMVATLANCAGTLKPCGTFSNSVVSPAMNGRNSILARADPPASVTAAGTAAPTFTLELVTVTLTDRPPATGCGRTKFISESSSAEQTTRSVLAAPVVVRMVDTPIPDLVRITPEGARVTVPLPLANPGALAV